MKKLILLSIIIAAIAIPARAARAKDPRVGFKQVVRHTLIFNLVYLFLVMYVWMRLS